MGGSIIFKLKAIASHFVIFDTSRILSYEHLTSFDTSRPKAWIFLFIFAYFFPNNSTDYRHWTSPTALSSSLFRYLLFNWKLLLISAVLINELLTSRRLVRLCNFNKVLMTSITGIRSFLFHTYFLHYYLAGTSLRQGPALRSYMIVATFLFVFLIEFGY